MMPCLLCGGFTNPFNTPSDGKSYFRCNECGYVFLDPLLRISTADERTRYLLHENDPEDPGYRRWLEDFARFVNSMREKSDGGLRILDFGSGPVPAFGDILRHPGDTVVNEDPFFAPGIREGKFGIITALEVLEHLGNPGEELHRLVQRLEQGGILAVSTQFLPGNPNDFDRWPYRSDSTHIGFFTEISLVSWARNHGLRQVAGDGIRFLGLQKGALAPVETGVLG